jgi:hypothetical protein
MRVRSSIWIVSALLCAFSLTPPNGWCQDNGGSGSNDPSAQEDPAPLFPDPLFPDPLFSNESMQTRLDNDTKKMTTANASFNASSNPSASAAMMDTKISDSQVDDEMRRQMKAVSKYLYRYCLRNGSRFPGPSQDGSLDIMWAAQAQLAELVPNNPYSYGPTESLNWGIPANTNANGSPTSGSPIWQDQYQEGLVANQRGRVLLNINFELNPTIANNDAQSPPEDWKAAPGTITAIGNNQGFFIVWGADRNGKPIKNPINGLTDIISVSTSGTVQDTHNPNGI